LRLRPAAAGTCLTLSGWLWLLQGNLRMCVDQSRIDGQAGAINDPRVGWNIGALANGFNETVSDNDGSFGQRAVGDSHDPRIFDGVYGWSI
jgi:hypothetical protein